MLSLRVYVILATVAAAAAVSQAFGRFSYAVLLTDIRDEFGIGNTLAGTFGSLNLVAYLAGSLIVSLFAARFALARLAACSVAVVTAGLAMLAWAPSEVWVGGGLFLTGIAAAGVWIIAPALATAELGDTRRGLAVGVAVSGIGIGIVLAAVLDTLIAWRGVYLVEASIGVAVALSLLIFCRREARSSAPALGLGAVRLIPGWPLLMLAYGAFGLGMSIVITFLVALLEDDTGMRSVEASVAFALLGLGSILGGPLIGAIADRLSRRAALVLAYAVMLGSILVVAWSGAALAHVAAFVFGIAFNGVPVAITVVVSDHAQGPAFGSAYGVVTIVFGLGLALGPQLGGWLADLSGSFSLAFALAAVWALVGLICAMLIPGPRPAMQSVHGG